MQKKYLLFLLAAVLAVPSDIICPDDDPKNCYPKNFVASSEWQVIKPGQVVPEGLHYRMDFETGLKEAKFMDETPEGENAVVAIEPVKETVDSIKVSDDTQQVLGKSSRFNDKLEGEGNSFADAIESFKSMFHTGMDLSDLQVSRIVETNFDEIAEHLNALVYSSHDIKYGEQLTRDDDMVTIFLKLAINEQNSVQLKEKILRILGSSVRNNDESIKNVIHNSQFLYNSMKQVIEQSLAKDEQILIKRSVSLLNAIIYNDKGLTSFETSQIKGFLEAQYDKFSEVVKDKCNDLLNDYDMLVQERKSFKSEL